jgi:hypothetical protein
MKTKNIKHRNNHHTVHIRIERFFRHRTVLSIVASFMAVGVVKYQTHMMSVIQEMYGHGFGMVSTYTHHEEVTRMPVSYGVSVRPSPISGE